MLKFYLDNKEVQINSNAVFTKTLDNTLDSGSVELAFNEDASPVKPNTNFIVKNTENTDEWCFIVASDSVEVVQRGNGNKKATLYKHTLTLTEKPSKLQSHLMRNSTFAYFNRDAHIKCNFLTFSNFDTTTGEFDNTARLAYCDSNSTAHYMAFSPRVSVPSINNYEKAKLSIKIYTNVFDNCQTSGYLDEPKGWELNNYEYKSMTLALLKKWKEDGSVATNYQAIELNITQEDINRGYVDIVLSSDKMQELFSDLNETSVISLLPYNYVSGGYNLVSNFGLRTPSKQSVNRAPAGVALIQCDFQLIAKTRTLYDVLETLQKQSLKYYNSHNHATTFEMPSRTSEKGLILDSIEAPDYSFSGETLFECISDVLNYIDAVPVIDENNVLSFEYLNKLDNDLGSGTPIDFLKNKIVDKTSRISNENYVNDLYSEFQKAKETKVHYYPSKTSFKRTINNGYGLISGSNTLKADTDFPIDYIDHFYCYYGATHFKMHIKSIAYIQESTPWTFADLEMPKEIKYIDINDAIYSNDLYQSLSSTTESLHYFPCKQNTLKYTKGAKDIDLCGIGKIDGVGGDYAIIYYAVNCCFAREFGFGNTDSYNYDIQRLLTETTDQAYFVIDNTNTNSNNEYLTNLYFRVEYHAIYNGQTSAVSNENKYNGETYVSSNYNNPDLSKMLLNLQGVARQIGNEELNVSLPVDKWEQRIKPGSFFDKSGARYVANVIQTVFMGGKNYNNAENKVFQNVQFTKNFNSINNYVSLDKEKRYYEVSTELTQKGYQNLIEYIYFSTSGVITSSTSYINSINQKALMGATISNLMTAKRITTLDSLPYYAIYRAHIQTYTNEDEKTAFNLATINDLNEFTLRSCDAYLHTYGGGNTLNFEVMFDGDINAASRIEYGTNAISKPTLYSNDGFIEKFNIYFDHTSDDITETEHYPLSSNESYLIAIENYKYYKRPSEIFVTNFQIAMLPYTNDIIIGQSFLKDNAILGNEQPILTLYYSTDEEYNIFDKLAKGTTSNTIANNIVITYENVNKTIGTLSVFVGYKITITFGISITCESFALCDYNKNIYLAFNKQLTNATNFVFYVFSSRFKL